MPPIYQCKRCNRIDDEMWSTIDGTILCAECRIKQLKLDHTEYVIGHQKDLASKMDEITELKATIKKLEGT